MVISDCTSHRLRGCMLLLRSCTLCSLRQLLVWGISDFVVIYFPISFLPYAPYSNCKSPAPAVLARHAPHAVSHIELTSHDHRWQTLGEAQQIDDKQ